MSSPIVPLLLDSHVWYAYLEGMDKQIPKHVQTAIDGAAAVNQVLVSVVSIWELSLLESKGRIQMSVDMRTWVARALRLPGLRLKPLTPLVAVESTRLPGGVHGDPADRFLIATARLSGATLVTKDKLIVEYANRGFLRVIDAASHLPPSR